MTYKIWLTNVQLSSSTFNYRMTFEFPATGGVYPYQKIDTVNLLKYTTQSDYFLQASEIIFCIYIIYYIIEERFLYCIVPNIDIQVISTSIVFTILGFNVYLALIFNRYITI